MLKNILIASASFFIQSILCCFILPSKISIKSDYISSFSGAFMSGLALTSSVQLMNSNIDHIVFLSSIFCMYILHN